MTRVSISYSGEAGAAQTHQTAGADGVLEGLQIGDLRGSNGRVHRLLAIGDDDHGGLDCAVGRGDGGDAVHLAGHAGVDVGRDKAAGLAHHRADIDLIALGHSGRSRCTDVLAHGQNDLRRQRHNHRLKVGSSLLVGNSRALCGTFEEFTHSNFDLPILQSRNTVLASSLCPPLSLIRSPGCFLPPTSKCAPGFIPPTHDKIRRLPWPPQTGWEPPTSLRQYNTPFSL